MEEQVQKTAIFFCLQRNTVMSHANGNHPIKKRHLVMLEGSDIGEGNAWRR